MRIGIIGGGPAGLYAAKKIKSLMPDARVTVFDRETEGLYAKIRLPELVSGSVPRVKLFPMPPAKITADGTEYRPGVNVTKIQQAPLAIVPENGEPEVFDKIIFASGAEANLPPIPGLRESKNVCTLRHISDADRLAVIPAEGKTAAVLGGGLLGLEIAFALHKKGFQVKVLEAANRLLERSLTEAQSQKLKDFLDANGVSVIVSAKTAEVKDVNDGISILLADGSSVAASFLLVAAGVRSNTEAAEASGIACNRGILVSGTLETNIPNVYATGDCAEQDGVVSGLWIAAKDEGEALAEIIAGQRTEYKYPVYSPALKITGVDLKKILE